MPLTSLIAKKVATTVAKKIQGAVIERWTRYRAERFFEGFAESLTGEFVTGIQTDDVDERLSKILTDDTKSEVLFDAYRRVCFSKSKTLGPRIIGLLTGQIVHEGRMANLIEEKIFDAAERMSDPDLIEFMKSYEEHRKKADNPKLFPDHQMLGGSIIIEWLKETSDTTGFSGRELDIGAFPWKEAFGRWAGELKSVGLMEERMRQINKWFDGEEESGLRTSVTTTVTFHSGCAQLNELLSRSLGPNTPTEDD